MSAGPRGPNPRRARCSVPVWQILRFQQDEMPRSNCCTNGGNLAPIASDLLTQFGIAVPAAPGFSQVIALISYARDTINQYRYRLLTSIGSSRATSQPIFRGRSQAGRINARAVDDKFETAYRRGGLLDKSRFDGRKVRLLRTCTGSARVATCERTFRTAKAERCKEKSVAKSVIHAAQVFVFVRDVSHQRPFCEFERGRL